MIKHRIKDLATLSSIMENAFQHNLTFYDSAYLTVAKQHNLTLITQDEQLAKAAIKANIPVKETENLK